MRSIFTLALLTSALLTTSAMAQELPPPSIYVTGQCNSTLTPDRGRVVLTAEVKDSQSPQKASMAAQKIYDDAKRRVEKLSLRGVRLETSEFNLSPHYTYNQSTQQQVLAGYVARIGLSVETEDVARIGDVVSEGVNAGLTQIQSMEQFVSAKLYQQATRQCFDEAIRDANQQAKRAAELAGVKLGRARYVDLQQGGGSPMPMVRNYGAMKMMAATAEMAAMPPVSVAVGQRDVAVSVAVTYAIE